MIRTLLTVTALLISAALAGPASAQTTRPAGAGGFTVGVCTHFSQRKGVVGENLDVAAAANVGSIRDEVPWSQVEKEKGTLAIPERYDEYVDAAIARGLEPMLVLAYGNKFYENGRKPSTPESVAGYVRYCEFVVAHFRGRVRRYEVWNEYNIGIGTAGGAAGTPEGYVELLRAAGPAVKGVDPSAEVIGGVVAPRAIGDGWLRKAIGLGLPGLCDAVSIHTYNYAAQPPERRRPEAWVENVGNVAGWLREANGGTDVPLYVTEHGWPTHGGPTGTPAETSADYLARAYLLGRTVPSLRGLWWYDFQDDGWDPALNEDNFGLVTPDLTPHPAYNALADVAPLAAGSAYEGRIDLGDDATHALRFRRPDGSASVVVWSAATGDAPPVQVVLSPGGDGAGDDARVTVRLVGRPAVPRAFVDRDWVGRPQSPVVRQLAVTAGPTPVIVDLPASLDSAGQPSTAELRRRAPAPTTQPLPPQL